MSETHERLREVLRERFGHAAFRPHQEEVCASVTAGRDALLVMPTGSGKSLCYQLPGVARGGTTLVVSPLIALIEDQVARLRADGFRAERIHSGRGRPESRQVCRDYLADELDFLFIAPERLSVPGFPELLARRELALIAVDEAHCISHWGHDFRPAYRLLGERLPLLRPAPVLALTATATVRVQKDVVQRLGMAEPEMFIRGFWRDNLAVEARDCPRGERDAVVRTLLEEPGARPAIVYVPTRKESDRLATELADLGAVAYHAGMDSAERSRSQEAFMGDRATIVVATVAFGMGVDKPDIRTVIHTSLPGSVESYYQEIGRAGRDGKLARVVLLYSWSDRKLLEFLHARSYPPTELLQEVLARVPADAGPLPREAVLTPGDEAEDAALRQLVGHGALLWGPDDRLERVPRRRWRKDYEAQREHRLGQIEDMVSFAQSGGCRMHSLVRYFSPAEAGRGRCGHCDQCAPENAVARQFRAPSDKERAHLDRLLAGLVGEGDMTPRQLLERVFAGVRDVDRDRLDRYLDCLGRAGLVRQDTDSFEKEGRTILFQRLCATGAAHTRGVLDGAELWIDGPAPAERRAPGSAPTPAPKKKPGKKGRAEALEAMSPGAAERFEALRDWRAESAKTRGVPAFHIASDALLIALSLGEFRDREELLAVKGIGARKAEEHGDEILDLLRRYPLG